MLSHGTHREEKGWLWCDAQSIIHWQASVFGVTNKYPMSSTHSETVRRFKRKHLTATDCQHLARKHLAATQPFIQRWTSRDPNHGLYPRPRRKGGDRGMSSEKYLLFQDL